MSSLPGGNRIKVSITAAAGILVIGGILLAAVLLFPRKTRDAKPLQKLKSELILYDEVGKIPVNMTEPKGLAVDGEGRVYVVGDRRLSVYDNDGSPVLSVELEDTPSAITAAESGLLYLGLTDHVEVYNRAGNREAVWVDLGEKSIITSIAAEKTPDGEVVCVADAGNRQILTFDTFGRLASIKGGFLIPSPYFDVAVDRDGTVWAADTGRHRLRSFSTEGEPLTFWGKPSIGVEGFCGCCNPAHFVLLSDGGFVTAEKGLSRVKLYDPLGNFVGLVADPAVFSGIGGMDLAVGLHDLVYVLDSFDKTIRLFKIKAGVQSVG